MINENWWEAYAAEGEPLTREVFEQGLEALFNPPQPEPCPPFPDGARAWGEPRAKKEPRASALAAFAFLVCWEGPGAMRVTTGGIYNKIADAWPKVIGADESFAAQRERALATLRVEAFTPKDT